MRNFVKILEFFIGVFSAANVVLELSEELMRFGTYTFSSEYSSRCNFSVLSYPLVSLVKTVSEDIFYRNTSHWPTNEDLATTHKEKQLFTTFWLDSTFSYHIPVENLPSSTEIEERCKNKPSTPFRLDSAFSYHNDWKEPLPNRLRESCHTPSVFLDALRPALLETMSCTLRPALLEPQEAVPQALTLSRGAMLITWRLRHPSLGECRRGLRHFWECQGYLGYSPAPGHTLKRPCATLVLLVGRTTNTNEGRSKKSLRTRWRFQLLTLDLSISSICRPCAIR